MTYLSSKCRRLAICLAVVVGSLVAFGCTASNFRAADNSDIASLSSTGEPSAEHPQSPAAVNSDSQTDVPGTYTPVIVDKAQRVGSLEGAELTEISGISASQRYPGIIYAINDSGNAPRVYALTETGKLVASWDVAARNRDWEDMTHITIAGTPYLIIGDTGNNLIRKRNSQLLLLPEPSLPKEVDSLTPASIVQFDYVDGPHNVESIAAIGNSIYLLSKEPVTSGGPAPSKVYRLDLPDNLLSIDENVTLQAQFVATMPRRSLGLQATLAAALAGVDLSHPTAMSYDATTNSFYVLSYREVLRIPKDGHQSWAEAFGSKAERVLSQSLPQAEALTLTRARTLLFTSENSGAPVWAVPLPVPL